MVISRQISAFAAFIGIDEQADGDLLWIAEDAIQNPLPPGGTCDV
jgi:hypothetical protein